jgi:class 3 adenylate cyclase
VAVLQPSPFGALLRRYRRRAGLTQEELAERAELSPRGLIYLERDERHPQPGTARRLADALGLSDQERTAFLASIEDAEATDGEEPGESLAATGIRTFLIADMRGYTAFTEEHGDEAAAELARGFAATARETVLAHGGEVIELRGDEALAVFSSARQALHAAVAFQERCVGERSGFIPLGVGIGLDAGEAIPVEGGYRGGALNLATRLCSLAGAGEVLASETVTHLARRVQGLSYAERGAVQLKGFAEPVRVVQIVP